MVPASTHSAIDCPPIVVAKPLFSELQLAKAISADASNPFMFLKSNGDKTLHHLLHSSQKN